MPPKLKYFVCLGIMGIAACTTDQGDVGSDPICPKSAKAALLAPVVVSPKNKSLDVTPENLAIQIISTDSSSDDTLNTDIEIFRVTDKDEERVWFRRAETSASSMSRLDDGSFESTVSELIPWKKYRVRSRVQETGECRWSEWSESIDFRIDDGSTILFNEDKIHEIRLDIPEDSFSRIDAQARPNGCVPHHRDYHSATVHYEEQSFPGVGLRGKGGCGSSRRLNDKSSFKTNLSWDDPQVEGQPETRRLHGMKRLTLNNQVQDPSYVHERLTYFLYKEFSVPSARVAPIRTLVNDELWGLYLNVETMDRRFLSRWFESNQGMMYEGTYFCDLVAENIPDDEDGVACFTKKFDTDDGDTLPEGADPTTFELLRDLTAQLDDLNNDNFYPAINDTFDFDTYLSHLAIDTIVDDFDSYHYRIGNNFRVYHDPTTGKWTMIPQGVDQTFAVRNINPFEDTKALLARRCINNNACATAFVARLREVLAVFESTDLVGMVQSIQTQIQSEVEADPRREFSVSEWEDAVDDVEDFINDRPTKVRQFISNAGY